MDKIIIKGAKYEVNIGVTAEERDAKQPLLIDIVLHYDLGGAASSDSIEETINYSKVCKSVAALLNKEYKLIETVAEAVASEILLSYPVSKLEVMVRKPGALRIADYAAVQIMRER